MTNPEIPPIPEKFLERLKEPVCSPEKACDCSLSEGTVWEVVTPYGELVLLLIVEWIEPNETDAFAFARAIPLTDMIQKITSDTAVVTISPTDGLFTAHCWLEGPVKSDAFVRCIGELTDESKQAVERARSNSQEISFGYWDKELRKSLYEQFDPVFTSTWEKLYSLLGDLETEATNESALRPEVSRSTNPSRAKLEVSQPALAAGNTEPDIAILDRLASYSSEEVLDLNYQKAWAYFLASTFRGTASRDGWLKAFLSLSSVETSLAAEWVSRFEKAKFLSQDRDWKRRFSGEKVYGLEAQVNELSPDPSCRLTVFAKLLASFAELDPVD